MLFERYQAQSKTIVHHLLQIGGLGVVASAFSLLIVLSTPPAKQILPWCVFGVSVGMNLVFTGAFFLHRVPPVTGWGRWLTARSDQWFPFFLFVMQKLFFTLFALLLWAMLYHLGVPSSWFRNTLFILLLVLLPVRNMVGEYARIRRTDFWGMLTDLLHYTVVALSTLLTISIITSLTLKPGSPGELNMLDILLWILGILIVTVCLVLFLSRFPRHRPHPARPRKKHPFFFIRTGNKPEY